MAGAGRIWLSVFVQAGVILAFPVFPAARPSDADLQFAEGYLEKFYGFKPQAGRQKRVAEFDSEGFPAKLKEMQQFFGLAESGELDQQTLTTMRKGRCGLSDAEQFGETMRWRNRTLTYRFSNYPPKMKPSQIRRVFKAAWRLWAQVTPLKFRRRARRDADIEISFSNKDHEDGAPFDGKGGVLAHAFLPGPGIGGDVHFDAEEDWTSNTTGYDIFAVAVHEFGHALGVSHSSDPGAVMYPAYNFAPHDEIQLSFQDVKDVQELYGESSVLLEKPPPRTPDKCDPDLSFDAVTELQQEVVFFKDRFMWRTHTDFNEIGITLIRSLWTGIPTHLDAAYEDLTSYTMVFFKGSQYWEVKHLEVKDGYPKNISDFGFPSRIKSVDAALHFREYHVTVFFTGGECWRYDEEKQQMMDGYPKLISDEWPGVPSPIDASVAYKGFVYFFLGNLQLEFDLNLGRITNKMLANTWLKCRGQTNQHGHRRSFLSHMT
ncbi:matrix metalloproteinase-18 [Astyanax mexicanus]|uniref:matrix metalloproteinase-18 n=1 Tax=Astyanax mexicanus TaxID=7994 RepID=UPI0020CABF2B|nr:matrix metalloproteinase-18 [Astyanax mexicanus]